MEPGGHAVSQKISGQESEPSTAGGHVQPAECQSGDWAGADVWTLAGPSNERPPRPSAGRERAGELLEIFRDCQGHYRVRNWSTAPPRVGAGRDLSACRSTSFRFHFKNRP